ncbi:MAG: NTP transferase domain-containing protein, partial [Gammaproteobacteria bacterium]|nr:NTP transferase domain-containing protein [Gammaproteobacteria bacterium]
WEAAAIFLGDMPYLQIETIQKLVDSCHNNMAKEPIVVPVKSGRQGHPVIFHHHYFNEIEALEGDQGAKPVIDAHRQAVIEVSLDDEGIFMDIDRPQEAVCS